MTEKQGIITALQNEIAAAQKKRAETVGTHIFTDNGLTENARLCGYIQGLNQALYLLTREPARELEY